MADRRSIDRLVGSIEEEFGWLEVPVNNAGISNNGGQRGVDADLDRVREALEARPFRDLAPVRGGRKVGPPKRLARNW